MLTDAFFVCPDCGNVKKFKIFTSNFQVVYQSPETGKRIDESSVLPSLREDDNYIECQRCFKKVEYNKAIDVGKRYIRINKKFRG